MTELATRDLTWARKITERLRLQATNYAEAREKVIGTLIEARDGGASALLGYPSWTVYMADVFGDAPLRLERDARQELAAELSAEGMSTRAIAPIFGTTHKTIVKDLQSQVVPEVPPADEPEPRQVVDVIEPEPYRDVVELFATEEREGRMDQVRADFSDAVDARNKITGMDGKQYPRPEPKKAQRRALTDQARDAGWEVRKSVERIERIWEDDRFSRNKEEVATLLRGHLMYVIETCQGFLDDIDQNEEN